MKLKRQTIIMICFIGSLLLANMILVPFMIKLPFFMHGDIHQSINNWLSYGVFKSIKEVFLSIKLRKVFFMLQMPFLALLIYLLWDINKVSVKNKISEGVGGPEPGGAGQHGTSRWQNKNEMDKKFDIWLTNDEIKKGGIVFGAEKVKNYEKVWLNKDDTHTLIIGATRSGKSRKIILPSIYLMAKAEESMILSDPKGELYIYTKDYLKREGYKVIVMNFREPLKGNQWNILENVNKAVDKGDISKATEIAWDIAHTIVNQTPSANTEPIWKNGEESTIAALILLASINSQFEFQRNITSAFYFLSEYGQPLPDGTVPLLEYIRKLPVTHPAKAAFATASIAPLKTRASFFTSALADLRLFSDPYIADMTLKQDHTIFNIGIEKTAVFLIIPDEKTTRNVLASLYIDQVYQQMVELAINKGGRIPRRINFMLDEFGNLPPINEFDKKLTVSAGRGMRFTIAVQDVAQLKKLYDKNSQTITGNCHNWLYLKTADIETAKLISDKTGAYTIETENASTSVQSKNSNSSTHGIGLTGRALLLQDEVLRWPDNEVLLLPIGTFPARFPIMDLSKWNANSEFGFSMTGNVEEDKSNNLKMIEKREGELEERKLNTMQLSSTVPLLYFEEEMNQELQDSNIAKKELELKTAESLKNEESSKSEEDITCEESLEPEKEGEINFL